MKSALNVADGFEREDAATAVEDKEGEVHQAMMSGIFRDKQPTTPHFPYPLQRSPPQPGIKSRVGYLVQERVDRAPACIPAPLPCIGTGAAVEEPA